MASIARLETEPGTTENLRIQARAIQASSNRFAHSVMALEAVGMGSIAGRMSDQLGSIFSRGHADFGVACLAPSDAWRSGA